MRGLALVFVLAVALHGQEIRGPVSGVIYNPSARAIQPIAGVPGGAWLGEPILGDLDWAVVAPDGNRAVAVRGGETYLVQELRGSASWVRLEGVPLPELAAWKGDSSGVAVYADRSVWVCDAGLKPGCGLKAAPQQQLRALAYGEYVAGATESGVFAIEDPPRLLAPMNGTVALAFCGGALFAADRDQVLEIRGAAFPAGPRGHPGTGLACSADGRALIVTGRGAANVYDVRRRVPVGRVELDFEADRLEPIAGGRLFLLKQGGPVFVLAVEPSPAAFFIPEVR